MKIAKTAGESLATGPLARGCDLCIEGRKLVLFVTGVCNKNCEYCTISEARWQKDEVWANEKKVEKPEDIIEEAKLCKACGAGITGGEPLMKIDRVIEYIKLLKNAFGKDFHIHMYTNGTLATPDVLKRLHDAGLDELRVHLNKDIIKDALKLPNWKVGMEVPCIPGQEKELCGLMDFLEAAGAHFLNLNELEFSERNIEPMETLGMVLRTDSLTAVEGSHETAEAVLRYAENKNLPVHFCTARLKLDYQLRNRLTNRAKSIRKPFEKVTKNGFLRKGVIEGNDLEKAIEELKKMKTPERMMHVNTVTHRIELSEESARIFAKKSKFKVSVVEEYPSADPWDWEKTPLN
jgi:pyruvate formate-lyase activating enzyme-like uncharacterized protein